MRIFKTVSIIISITFLIFIILETCFYFGRIYLNKDNVGFLINFSDKVQSLKGDIFLFNVDQKVVTIFSALGLENVINILEDTSQVEKHLLQMASKNKE